jgi:hypothetical protein
MLTLEKEEVVIPSVFNYIKECQVISKYNHKNSRSIYFRDKDGNYTVFIYNFLYGSATMLATMDGAAYNTTISKESFDKIFRAY